MNGPGREGTESPILEKISGKKTLAALLRENSRRLSDAKIQSVSESLDRQDSGRYSDVKLHFISDSLSREDSFGHSDSTSVSDSLSRQDSGISDGRKQSNSDARKQSNGAALSSQNSRVTAKGKSLSTEKSIELPRRDYPGNQQEKAKTVKQQAVVSLSLSLSQSSMYP